MKRQVELVIALQQLDLRTNELEREIASLPKHLASLEKTLDAHIRKLEADKATLAANQKERRSFDGEIQLQQQKASKLRDQMNSAKTNEQFRAFQHEIAFCEQAIRKAEDRVLELMLEAETLEANVKAAEASLAREKEQVEKEQALARDKTAEDKNLLQQIGQQRQEIIAQLEPDVSRLYDRARKRYGGVAVSDGTEGRCSACHLDIRLQVFQELRRGEKLLTCEYCGRILYYNPPVAFDTQTGAPVSAEGGTRVDMT